MPAQGRLCQWLGPDWVDDSASLTGEGSLAAFRGVEPCPGQAVVGFSTRVTHAFGRSASCQTTPVPRPRTPYRPQEPLWAFFELASP
jgi:hypothetical protein